MKFARHYKQLHQLGKILPARFPVLPPSDTDREQPFFIVSAGRSGSTLMASLLGQHSEISMPTEQFVLAQSIVKFNLFNWMQWEDCSALICTEFIRSKGSQAWSLDAQQLIDQVHAFPKAKRNLWNLLDHIYRSYGVVRKAPKRIWGDKTPGNHEHIDIIRSVFPKAKYLFLIRDGRDVVNSYLKKADESDDPLFGVEEWNRSIEKMDGIRKKLSYHQLMDLRYEDLVADAKACFSSVCSFLELAYEPIHERSGKRYLEEMGSIGEMESMVHVNQPINPSSVGKWKNELDPKVLEQVEHLIKKGLERFGYSL